MFTYFPATQIKRYLHRKVQNTTLHAHSANSHSCTLSLSYLNAEMIIKGIQTMYTEIIWLGNWQPKDTLHGFANCLHFFSSDIPCRKSGCAMRPNKEKDLLQHRSGTNPDNVPCLLCLQLPPHHPPHPPPLLGLLHHQSRLQGGKRDDSKNKFYLLRWCWPTTQWRTQGVSRKAPVTKVMMDLLCVTDSVVSAYLSDNKKRNKWCVSF